MVLRTTSDETTLDFGPFKHYIHGYIGNFNYCFLFSAISDNTDYGPMGHLLIQLYEGNKEDQRPMDGVNDWTNLQREDALIGDGGVLSHAQSWG